MEGTTEEVSVEAEAEASGALEVVPPAEAVLQGDGKNRIILKGSFCVGFNGENIKM